MNNPNNLDDLDELTMLKEEYGLLLIGAVIFTASFLWKDLITDFGDLYFPKAKNFGIRIIYVIFVTLVLVTIIVYLKRSFGLTSKPTPSIGTAFDDYESRPGDIDISESE